MINFAIDEDRKLIRLNLTGLLTPEDVAEFSRKEQAAIAKLGWKSGDFVILADTSRSPVQPQEIVAAFQHMIGHNPLKARRVAVVIGGSLARLQAKRILVRGYAETFETTAEAEAWLFADAA